jgi:hypothetical protein
LGKRLVLAVVVLVATACGSTTPKAAGPTTTTTTATTATTTTAVTTAPPGALAIAVGGATLLDGRGNPIVLHGVNRSGTEYACQQGWGIFDGPSDDESIAAMVSWRINVVRVPLNEGCWLGINGVNDAYGGSAYRAAIADYVRRLHEHGLYVVLDLHVAAPGTTLATEIVPMADADHAPAFWQSVASTFIDDHALLFDLYNEPHDIDWSCWRDGCAVNGYQAAGMQQLLDAVRSTGATQPVLAGGLRWSNDLSEWLAHRPSDPASQLVASLHTYDFSPCFEGCRASAEAVAGQVPVIAGEIGEADCEHGYIDDLMAWLDRVRISYLGWTWNSGGGWTCTGGPTLITSYDGTPTGFGVGYRDHLATLG